MTTVHRRGDLRRAEPAVVDPAARRPAGRGRPPGAPPRRGRQVEVVDIELRELAHDITNNLLTGFPGARAADGDRRGHRGRRADRGDADLQRVLQRAVQVVLRRARPQALAGKPVLIAATGGTARHSLVLEYALRPLFSYLKASTGPHRRVRGDRRFRCRRCRPVAGRPGAASGRRTRGDADRRRGRDPLEEEFDLGPAPPRSRAERYVNRIRSTHWCRSRSCWLADDRPPERGLRRSSVPVGPAGKIVRVFGICP